MSAPRSAIAAARPHRSHDRRHQRPPAGQQPPRPVWHVLLVPPPSPAEPLPEPELIYAADSLREARDCAASCLPNILAGALGRIRIEQAGDVDATPPAANTLARPVRVAGKGGVR